TPEYLKTFYLDHGHLERDIKSLDDILERERRFPNSSLDAKRIIGRIERLLGPSHSPGPREVASVERSISKQMTGFEPVAASFEDYSPPEGSFDAILMSQVLEHARDVDLWARKAVRLLAPKGVLAIALPNFGSIFRYALQENEPYVIPPAHLNYFDARSLSTLLSRRGYEVTEIQWVSRIDPNVVFRRVPATRLLGQGIRLPLRLTLAMFDLLHLGMMLNVYARKGAR
ncbi:MAG: class I SAM-dependent methyltransferase, partial [Acidobacteria bacterium]|nr:class I SAM-dependent methyltransferase [Acidobacteriota bacterium]